MPDQEPVFQPLSLYLRTAEGATYYVSTLKEALEVLISDNGYRLTISDQGSQNEMVIRVRREFEERVFGGMIPSTLDTMGLECENVQLIVRSKEISSSEQIRPAK